MSEVQTTNEKIGQLISQIRQDRGLTQVAFARQLGTSQSAINRIEHGHQNLSLETLGRISDVLDKQILALSGRAVNLQIEGGYHLRGSIDVKTAKNSVVAMLFASLLNQGTTTLKKVPHIEEVNRVIEVLNSIGVITHWNADNTLEIRPPKKLELDKINQESAKKTRIVILMVGALMHDYKDFKIPYAGGCELGRRTVLPHIYALAEFGTSIIAKSSNYHIHVSKMQPRRPVVLYEMSDITTENAILAASRLDTETVIKMASANYQVQDLCFFLQKMGVKIEGIGSTTLRIRGVKYIKKNVTYTPSEDPVEAMTFLAAAIATDSSITIKRVPIDFLELELLKLEKMGLHFSVGEYYKSDNGHTNLADLTVRSHKGKLKAPEEKLHPLPGVGLNIDNLPYFVPIAAVARGRTLIHDWVYEDRALMFTEIKKLGVDLELADPHRVFINGPTRWRGTEIVCPSGLRPAVILLIGMLAAPGISMLRNVYTINRGYEDLAKRFNSLGAKITVLHEV